ncbi:hypothetical protein, partial [Paracoccus sp. (in: a-proteobacteria)]|uniref:hypothetical protein n=1 Tax=Paracoccus sp. TaxID=267 RepID=UPI00396C78A3
MLVSERADAVYASQSSPLPCRKQIMAAGSHSQLKSGIHRNPVGGWSKRGFDIALILLVLPLLGLLMLGL